MCQSSFTPMPYPSEDVAPVQLDRMCTPACTTCSQMQACSTRDELSLALRGINDIRERLDNLSKDRSDGMLPRCAKRDTDSEALLSEEPVRDFGSSTFEHFERSMHLKLDEILRQRAGLASEISD